MLTGVAAAACRRGLLASSSSGSAAASSSIPALLLRGLSTAAPPQPQTQPPTPTPPQQSKAKGTGKTLPTRNSRRISAPTLEGKPAAAILADLQAKCEGGNRPRLSDLHALLDAARKSHIAAGGSTNDKAAAPTVLLGGVELFVRKNVEFSEETSALFLRAMCRAGGLSEAVDALLDRSKRLGIWAPRKTVHMALLKLGQAKDTERLLKVYRAMHSDLGVERTARSVHLAVRGLANAGAVEDAEAVAAEAEGTGMVLADSTKDILSAAKQEASAAAAEKSGEGEVNEEAEAGAAAAAEPKK